MAKLPSVFKKGGVVTAASASGICDGAAAVIGKNKTKLPKKLFLKCQKWHLERLEYCMFCSLAWS